MSKRKTVFNPFTGIFEYIVNSILSLKDTPDSFADQADKHLSVNLAEDSIVFVEPGVFRTSSLHDMTVSAGYQMIRHGSYTLLHDLTLIGDLVIL